MNQKLKEIEIYRIVYLLIDSLVIQELISTKFQINFIINLYFAINFFYLRHVRAGIEGKKKKRTTTIIHFFFL